MIRFTRKGTLKSGAVTPHAMSWAAEFNSFMNTKFDINVQYGLEMFNGLKVTWFLDCENLAELEAINQKIMMDQDYWAWVAKADGFWVDGSLEDTVVNVM